MKFFMDFLNGEEGATATEYILLVVFIALVMAGGAVIFGDNLADFFARTGGQLDSVTNPVLPTDGGTPDGGTVD